MDIKEIVCGGRGLAQSLRKKCDLLYFKDPVRTALKTHCVSVIKTTGIEV